MKCPRCGARYKEDPSCGKTIHDLLPPREADDEEREEDEEERDDIAFLLNSAGVRGAFETKNGKLVPILLGSPDHRTFDIVRVWSGEHPARGDEVVWVETGNGQKAFFDPAKPPCNKNHRRGAWKETYSDR